MKKIMIFAMVVVFWLPVAGDAEILAMLNYESKPNESLKDLKLPFGAQEREEGIAIMDVDPNSAAYGEILMEIPLPPDLVAHHIFYNRDATKIYLTALGKPELRVIDMTRYPYRVKVIDVPGCTVGENVVFSADNKTWYLSCMGSSVIVMGDAVNDSYTRTIESPVLYPHGIAIHEGIDRILVTSTVRASDFGDPGESIGVIEGSTGKSLGSFRVSDQASPANEAPVEVIFVPQSDPPVAYVTNMNGGTLWSARWNKKTGEFDARKAYDFAVEKAAVPLEIYFSDNGARLYVTTAKPGKFHIFDLSEDRTEVSLVKTLDVGEGAHHVAFAKDGRYAWVQNSFINLPGMSEGSISVVDMQSLTVVDTINTFIENGFNPNCMVLLPEWNHPMGH